MEGVVQEFGFGFFARGDIGDAAADQATVLVGEGDETDLAGEDLTGGFVVGPFEGGGGAFEGTLEQAFDGFGAASVGVGEVQRLGEVQLEQLFTRQLEELDGFLVDLDEASLVEVEHHDGIRRVLDEGLVLGFVFLQRALDEFTLLLGVVLLQGCLNRGREPYERAFEHIIRGAVFHAFDGGLFVECPCDDDEDQGRVQILCIL